MIKENLNLPIIPRNAEQVPSYLEELHYTLKVMYRDFYDMVNGDLKNEIRSEKGQYIPTVSGDSSAGSGTYTHQNGWVYRRGIFVDVWFDVAWTNHTGTGNLVLNLPYKVSTSSQEPFVGVLQPSNLTYTGDFTVLNAVPDTFTADLIVCATGAASANIAMDTSAQIQGFISYVGQRNQ